MTPLKYMLLALATYIVSIYIHELGHIIYFKKAINKKVKLRYDKGALKCGYPDDYKSMTNEQYFFLNASGVLSGMLPIFIVGMLIESRFFLILLFPYFWGAMHDVVNMTKYIRFVEWAD